VLEATATAALTTNMGLVMSKAKRKTTTARIETADDALFKLHDDFCAAYAEPRHNRRWHSAGASAA
jgi:hypothetical protein